MRTQLLGLLCICPFLLDAQISLFGNRDFEPTGIPEPVYYAFYDGVQMIEFDYLSAYHGRVNYLEQAQPRALTWEMVLGPPASNVYIFRDTNGVIIKQYGGVTSEKLLSVEASKKVARRHNGLASLFGSYLGFSQVPTRFIPYYQVGSSGYAENGTIGLIDSLGNLVLPMEYNYIMPEGEMFICQKDSTFEWRNQQLELVFSTTEYFMQPSQFHHNHADIMLDEKWGLMNQYGEIVVPCEYYMLISSFNEYGLAEVNRKGLIGFVDTTGEEIIKCKYQGAGKFSEGLIDVRLNDKWGYIDTLGKTVIPHRYEIGIWFQEGLARVAKREGSKYYFGYIDRTGKEVIPLQFEDARDFNQGTAEVMMDGKWKEIDKTGRVR